MWLWRDTARSPWARPGSFWGGGSRTLTLPTWGSFRVQWETTSRTGRPGTVTPSSVLPNWSVTVSASACARCFFQSLTWRTMSDSWFFFSVDQSHGQSHVSLPHGVGGLTIVLLHTGAPRHERAGGQRPQTGNLLLLQHTGKMGGGSK